MKLVTNGCATWSFLTTKVMRLDSCFAFLVCYCKFTSRYIKQGATSITLWNLTFCCVYFLIHTCFSLVSVHFIFVKKLLPKCRFIIRWIYRAWILWRRIAWWSVPTFLNISQPSWCWRHEVILKRRHTSARLQGVTSQMTAVCIFTVVRLSSWIDFLVLGPHRVVYFFYLETVFYSYCVGVFESFSTPNCMCLASSF
jgi:hypothetical protein